MITNLSYFLLLTSLLTLPGYALISCFYKDTLERNKALLSISLSYTLFVTQLYFFKAFELSHQSFFYLQSFILIASATSLLLFKKRNKRLSKQVIFTYIKSQLIPISLLIFISLYQFIFGPYTEIPADIYNHLSYWQTALENQRAGNLGPAISIAGFFQQKGLVWYHLLAFCTTLSNASPSTVIFITTWITKSLFLLSVYLFSLNIFKQHQHAKWIAILAVSFVSIHMGINVIAYIRYYSFAPTMLNFIVYFTAISLFLQLLSAQSLKQIFYLGSMIAILMVAASAIHKQETLFILIIVFCISFCIILQKIINKYFKKDGGHKFQDLAINENSIKHTPILIFLCFIIGYTTVYLYAQNNLPLKGNIGGRLWEFGEITSWFPNITILNLEFQFIRTITLWGVLIYICSLFFWRDIRHYVFLSAGLISPIFTVLNPFFVDLFLRLTSSLTLWRIAYIIPIHFTAALMIVNNILLWRSGGLRLYQKLAFLFIITLSILLLLPLKNTYQGVHYSRLPTFLPVQEKNSFEHLDDAIKALNQIQEKHIILTDPVTGYVVSSITHHHAYRKKFYSHTTGYIPFTFPDYSLFPLKKHKGKLILINRRSDALSQVGKLAKHWPENILQLRHYYPNRLLHHLESNPTKFTLLWESHSKDMQLYRIL